MITRNLFLRHKWMLAALLATLLLTCMPAAVQAAPAVPQGSSAPAAQPRHPVQAQLQAVGSKVSDAHARNEKLQAQVAQMERQNADRQQQLQQRDEEIAALQEKLQAAGAPASATSSGP